MKRLGLLAALVFGLAGCGGSGHAAALRVEPIGRDVGLTPGHALFLSPTRLGIVTWGSSSCPSVPDRLTVVSRRVIRIHLVTGSWRGGPERTGLTASPPPGGVCTTDWGTTQMAVAIDPSRVDVHHPLTVRLYYRDGTKLETVTAPPL